MIQVDIAIHGKLETDRASGGAGTLFALGVTGIFNQAAPRTAACPYVVFNEQSGNADYTYKQRYRRRFLYQIKAVTKNVSGAVARDLAQSIDQRIDALLTDAALTVTGHTLMVCRRDSDVSYAEQVSDALYQHEGALYDIQVTPG